MLCLKMNIFFFLSLLLFLSFSGVINGFRRSPLLVNRDSPVLNKYKSTLHAPYSPDRQITMRFWREISNIPKHIPSLWPNFPSYTPSSWLSTLWTPPPNFLSFSSGKIRKVGSGLWDTSKGLFGSIGNMNTPDSGDGGGRGNVPFRLLSMAAGGGIANILYIVADNVTKSHNHNHNNSSNDYTNDNTSILSTSLSSNEQQDVDNLRKPLHDEPQWLPTLSKWWRERTQGRRGLLVILVPALLSQLMILRTAVPFCLDRLTQYVQPLYLLTSVVLFQRNGPRFLQSVLLSGVCTGTLFMLIDTYTAGSNWVLLSPKPDSYAVVTGASSGLGREMAKQLFNNGFSLVLICRRAHSHRLHQFKDEMLSSINQNKNSGTSTEDRKQIDRDDIQRDESKDEIQSEGIYGTSFLAKKEKDARLMRRSHSHVKTSTNRLQVLTKKLKNVKQGKSVNEMALEEMAGDSTVMKMTNGNENARGRQHQRIEIIPCNLEEEGGASFVVSEMIRRGVADKIDVLINNAGFAVHSPLLTSPLSTVSDMIELNVKSVVTLIRLVAPRIAKRGGGGRIMIVGSVSAAGPSPEIAVYGATKAFLSSLSLSLRRELLPLGVMVTLALPGPTQQSYMHPHAAQSSAAPPLLYSFPGVVENVEKVGKQMFFALQTGRDVCVPGTLNKIYVHIISKLVPQTALAALAQQCWKPTPSWFPFQPHQSSSPFRVLKKNKIYANDKHIKGNDANMNRTQLSVESDNYDISEDDATFSFQPFSPPPFPKQVETPSNLSPSASFSFSTSPNERRPVSIFKSAASKIISPFVGAVNNIHSKRLEITHNIAVTKYRIDYFTSFAGHNLKNALSFANWELRRLKRSLRSWSHRFWHSPVIDYELLKRTMKGEEKRGKEGGMEGDEFNYKGSVEDGARDSKDYDETLGANEGRDEHDPNVNGFAKGVEKDTRVGKESNHENFQKEMWEFEDGDHVGIRQRPDWGEDYGSATEDDVVDYKKKGVDETLSHTAKEAHQKMLPPSYSSAKRKQELDNGVDGTDGIYFRRHFSKPQLGSLFPIV